jgi:hypothetical protein
MIMINTINTNTNSNSSNVNNRPIASNNSNTNANLFRNSTSLNKLMSNPTINKSLENLNIIPTSSLQINNNNSNNHPTPPLQLSTSSTLPIANPVVIIHQNNSISTNRSSLINNNNYNNNNNLNENIIIDDLNLSIPSSTASVTTSSSLTAPTSNIIQAQPQQSTGNNNLNDLNQMNQEIKYMKGYVNVLKERFTRKSLQNNSILDQTDNTIIPAPSSTNIVNHSNHHSSSTNLATSLNDYQRRRSCSSNNNIAAACSVTTPASYIKQYQSNQNKNAKYTITNSTPVAENNKKLFASTDDLRQTNIVSIVNKNLGGGSSNNLLESSSTTTNNRHSIGPTCITSTLSKPTSFATVKQNSANKFRNYSSNNNSANLNRYASNSVDHLQSADSSKPVSSQEQHQQQPQQTPPKEVVKCTYLNEINKDELPRPNFVSSVKNLFEKQISSNHSNNNSLHHHHNFNISLNNSSNNNNNNSIISNNNNINKSLSKQSSNSNCNNNSRQTSINNLTHSEQVCLFDKLKQNGTIVYEHNNFNSNSNDLSSKYFLFRFSLLFICSLRNFFFCTSFT